METILIRKLDTGLKLKLRIRAAEHGHSMEEEAREILRIALEAKAEKPKLGLGSAIRALVDEYGGFDLEIPPRQGSRPLPTFE